MTLISLGPAPVSSANFGTVSLLKDLKKEERETVLTKASPEELGHEGSPKPVKGLVDDGAGLDEEALSLAMDRMNLS